MVKYFVELGLCSSHWQRSLKWSSHIKW